MRLKKLGAALLVVAALAAVSASSASAAATTTDVQWYTGSSPGTLLTVSKTTVFTSIGTWTFDVHVAGTKYSLKVTEIRVVVSTLENTLGVATATLELEFRGVSISEPAGCTVPSTITTKSLTVSPDWMIGSTNYWKFVPTAGESTAFFTTEVTGCALATTITPKGSLFVQTANATGTQAVEQEVSSSEAINSTAGGTLHVGTETASLTGSGKFGLEGGEAFGTH